MENPDGPDRNLRQICLGKELFPQKASLAIDLSRTPIGDVTLSG
jgi:hypothetical protein